MICAGSEKPLVVTGGGYWSCTACDFRVHSTWLHGNGGCVPFRQTDAGRFVQHSAMGAGKDPPSFEELNDPTGAIRARLKHG